MRDGLLEKLTAPGEGFYDLVDRCRALVHEGDSERFGSNRTVNEACVAATDMCFGEIQGAYTAFTNVSDALLSSPLPRKEQGVWSRV